MRSTHSVSARLWATVVVLTIISASSCTPIVVVSLPPQPDSIAKPARPPKVGPAVVAPRAAQPDSITVAAFNIQVFGRSKRSKPLVMNVLADVAHEVDVLLVQEIRDSSEQTADVFLDLINRRGERTYAMFEGPRLGRTSSKEQYVIYYVPERVRLLDAKTLTDPDDVFEREPLVATFRAGNFDFTLVGCHIRPSDAEAELRALADAVDSIMVANPAERDIILLGDFNADGRYLDERRLVDIFPSDLFHVAIANDVDTMTTSDNTYDRIIMSRGTASSEYVAASAHVFEFDRVYGLDDEGFVRSVSDHYPVVARFDISAPDDDGN